jgi:hypothetical protein
LKPAESWKIRAASSLILPADAGAIDVNVREVRLAADDIQALLAAAQVLHDAAWIQMIRPERAPLR